MTKEVEEHRTAMFFMPAAYTTLYSTECNEVRPIDEVEVEVKHTFGPTFIIMRYNVPRTHLSKFLVTQQKYDVFLPL